MGGKESRDQIEREGGLLGGGRLRERARGSTGDVCLVVGGTWRTGTFRGGGRGVAEGSAVSDGEEKGGERRGG